MQPGDYVLIEVSDTGTGMTPEVMEKIFEPFFSTKEVGRGTGLGLSTVYGIVKQTGGYIFAESEEGKGTILRVFLPRHVEVAGEVERSRRSAEPREQPKDLTGSGTVLLVEDEDAVRSFAARALGQRGYNVLEAATGAEALEVFTNYDGEVDLVVSDVVMPEMDGPTLMKQLRSERPDLKIIFISGYAEDAFRKQPLRERGLHVPAEALRSEGARRGGEGGAARLDRPAPATRGAARVFLSPPIAANTRGPDRPQRRSWTPRARLRETASDDDCELPPPRRARSRACPRSPSTAMAAG